MTLAEKMILYRAKNNLSTLEAAKRCGISQQTWRYVEKAIQTATPVTEAKIRLLVEEEKEV